MDDYELKTVGANLDTDLSFADPLLKEQQRQITQMRDTLLTFDKDDIHSAKNAIQSITVMRIYHQIGRIIKFTEMMDKIEDRLYESIDYNLASFDTMDPQTMMMLLQIQEKLQSTMIESQKLIQPYLNIDFTAIAPTKEVEANSFGAAVFTQESRSKIRESAQAVLTALSGTDSPNSETDGQPETTDTTEVSEVVNNSAEQVSAESVNSTVSSMAADVLADLDSNNQTPIGDDGVPF